jgi:hypothetical protein
VSGPTPLPDAEQVLIAWLTAVQPDIPACRALPDDLADVVPLLQVIRVDGAVSSRIHDRLLLDLNAFGADDLDASALARQAEALLLGSRNTLAGGAVIRNAVSVSRPHWEAYPNTHVRLYTATYTVQLHPAPTS